MMQKSRVEWVFIEPGKRTQNSLIERFNRTFRQDVLNSYMFESLTELRKYS
jgi:putative transposase